MARVLNLRVTGQRTIARLRSSSLSSSGMSTFFMSIHWGSLEACLLSAQVYSSEPRLTSCKSELTLDKEVTDGFSSKRR